MQPKATRETFARLLSCFDADPERAAAKYEELRRVLIRFFEWRGTPFPEEHTDETFDRVAKRLGEGVAISNAGAYCYEVARLVCLETLKSPQRRRVPLSAETARIAAPEPTADASEQERRLACLGQCLAQLPEESRQLILEYYGDGGRARIDSRRAMAERLGVQRDALANRAQRLRNKLEECMARCLAQGGAI